MSDLPAPASVTAARRQRVLSGMRPTGAMHLGHFHGALKNWVRLQDQYDCFYFVADWHALTTHYEERDVIGSSGHEMVIDWLAAGLDPDKVTLFIQSRLPEHAELFTLLAMGTPLSWLERMPTYKDQIEKLKERDLATYGFLGYPLLQAADILIYRAAFVPVGVDQAPHVEITREVARRFNHLYGREPDFESRARAVVKKLAKTDARAFEAARQAFQESGDTAALERGRALIAASGALSSSDRERLEGYLRGTGKTILVEPDVLLTENSKLVGLDGEKMSKSYGNSIAMREEPAEVERKIRRMPTDPARVHRSDPGNYEVCPVWRFHQVYSTEETKDWVRHGCTTAAIGCLDCKQPVIEAIQREQAPWRERAEPYLTNPKRVHWILEVGTERARAVARETMREVRDAMGISY
ncbi:MAG TPA: tryptophan--tRNA ligase [Caldimonas sp.]|nr:tryptophan--tRNA ligase [Caldimonas sp.]HEX2542695.1 tryptophan--tRNA ligase [Caldimonas sp.]